MHPYKKQYIVDVRRKPLIWVGSARDEIARFPEDARRRAGFELDQVQQGRSPSDWKPLPSVGLGVSEIRVHAAGEHRVLYVARFREAVYVLHAFEKKTQQTPKRNIEAARVRFSLLVEARARGKDRP